jgi:mycofactocin precursor
MSESIATAKIPAPAEVTDSAAAAPPAPPPPAPPAAGPPPAAQPQVAITDLLVEEVSIDGMCGVY